MRRTPWWVLLPSGSAPLLLVGGWSIAQLLQGPDYDPVTDTISVLASHGAPGYWLMTGMLIVLGACYLATAYGLPEAAPAGRLALAGGGVSAMALTLAPAPVRGGALGHGAVAAVGFVLLAVWPALAADRGDRVVSWGLRPKVAVLASALMCATAVWFTVVLQTGTAPGIAERVVTFAQALWPLVVAVSCQLGPSRSMARRSRRSPAGIVAVCIRIASAEVTDFHQVLTDHARYWGERDLRSLHLLALVQEFSSTCLVARDEDGIRGYVFGFVTPDSTGYVHLIATRDDTRGTGLGRRLYAAFAEAAELHGARQLKAVTSVENTGSIAFHRSLGFETKIVDDYNGPGRAMAVFRRDLPLGLQGSHPAPRRP